MRANINQTTHRASTITRENEIAPRNPPRNKLIDFAELGLVADVEPAAVEYSRLLSIKNSLVSEGLARHSKRVSRAINAQQITEVMA